MHIFPPLFLLFIAVPLLELYVLIKVGGIIGAWPTVALVVLTAFIGALLLRWQGLATWLRLQETLARGQLPAQEMLEGVFLLIGGALLLTPGFFTDFLGFIALLPPTRKVLVRLMLKRMVVSGMYTRPSSPGPDSGSSRHTLEGEFWHDDDPKA